MAKKAGSDSDGERHEQRDVDAQGSAWRRWIGVVGLSLRRLTADASRPGLSRMTVSITVVAVAIAIFVVVAGTSLGLASQPPIDDAESEYWIVPESADTLTTVTAAEGPQLGDVHATSAELEENEEIDRATPVLVEVVEFRTDFDDDLEYIMAIGVVSSEDQQRVAGVSTEGLEPNDLYYADGTYDGDFSGDIVLSPAAAELLGAEQGDGVLLTRPGPGSVDQSFSVTRVSERDAQTVQGEVPVAVFQLSELQSFTGADAGDQADQILVDADSEAAVPIMEGSYPEATVVERDTPAGGRLLDAELPLAMALSALLITLIVTTLVVATTAGLEVEADRRHLAVLSALGLSRRSTTGLVLTRTLALAVAGGVVGAVLGSLGIVLVNMLVKSYLGTTGFALLSWQVASYGVAVAAIAGLLAAPYPVLLARRTVTLGELTR
jgi:putative ABC transport system permease protein